MIIYNVTIKVEPGIAREWLEWMKQSHIPEVMATGCFEQYRIVQLLEQDDSEGPTYAVQYQAASMDDYERYISNFAGTLRQQSLTRWGEAFIAFRSLMRVVQ